MNDPSKQIVNWKNVSTTEEKIAKLETSCKAMTAEIEKLKAELVKKDKNETVWMFIVQFWKICHQRNSE